MLDILGPRMRQRLAPLALAGKQPVAMCDHKFLFAKQFQSNEISIPPDSLPLKPQTCPPQIDFIPRLEFFSAPVATRDVERTAVAEDARAEFARVVAYAVFA